MDCMFDSNLLHTDPRRMARMTGALLALLCMLALAGQRGQAGRFNPIPTTAIPTHTSLTDTQPGDLSQAVAAVEPSNPEPALIDQATAFIEPFEGRHHRAYRDSRGHLTIGIGFNLDRPGAAEDIRQLLPGASYHALRRGDVTLTDAQIDTLLRHDAQRAIDTARRQIKDFDALPIQAKLIIIDMTYNTGSLHKWRNFRAALTRQDYAAAARAMQDSHWRRQTGQRARDLIQRMHRLAQS